MAATGSKLPKPLEQGKNAKKNADYLKDHPVRIQDFYAMSFNYLYPRMEAAFKDFEINKELSKKVLQSEIKQYILQAFLESVEKQKIQRTKDIKEDKIDRDIPKLKRFEHVEAETEFLKQHLDLMAQAVINKKQQYQFKKELEDSIRSDYKTYLKTKEENEPSHPTTHMLGLNNSNFIYYQLSASQCDHVKVYNYSRPPAVHLAGKPPETLLSQIKLIHLFKQAIASMPACFAENPHGLGSKTTDKMQKLIDLSNEVFKVHSLDVSGSNANPSAIDLITDKVVIAFNQWCKDLKNDTAKIKEKLMNDPEANHFGRVLAFFLQGAKKAGMKTELWKKIQLPELDKLTLPLTRKEENVSVTLYPRLNILLNEIIQIAKPKIANIATAVDSKTGTVSANPATIFAAHSLANTPEYKDYQILIKRLKAVPDVLTKFPDLKKFIEANPNNLTDAKKIAQEYNRIFEEMKNEQLYPAYSHIGMICLDVMLNKPKFDKLHTIIQELKDMDLDPKDKQVAEIERSDLEEKARAEIMSSFAFASDNLTQNQNFNYLKAVSDVNRTIKKYMDRELLLITMDEEPNRDKHQFLGDAELQQKPVLLKINNKYKIWGDPNGDGNYMLTQIDSKLNINKLSFNGGKIQVSDPLFTPDIIKELTKGHLHLGTKKLNDSTFSERLKKIPEELDAITRDVTREAKTIYKLASPSG